MDKVVQIQVIHLENDIIDIFALTDDGRLLIRPTKMSDYQIGEWSELTFPPKKVPTQTVKQ